MAAEAYYLKEPQAIKKGGLSVGRRLEILLNVRCRLGNETVSVRLKWSVKCRVTKSECQCRATLILV